MWGRRFRLSTLAAIAAGLLRASCAKKIEADTNETPARVQLTAATQKTIRRTVEADGALFPRDQASVVPKISAPVQQFFVS
jgi:hypothetical protein